MPVKRVALLGATGSIGRQAIEIVAGSDDLVLCGLMSGSQPLDALAAEHGVAHTQVGGSAVSLLEACVPDIVLNAIVGFAGVDATLWSLDHGVTLALANKESLVAAGELAVAAHRSGGGLLLPVDSEHSALFQCLEGRAPETVDALVLTASGGPFRGRAVEDLATVTVDEALAHPTWSMGRKISVDSATLANKGLELIEAHWLFGVPYEKIDVVVHPRSIVHSLVRFRDGALLAHLGNPDMRVPISFALGYPDRPALAAEPLDLSRPSTSSSSRSTTRRSPCSRSPGPPASVAGPPLAPTTRRTRSRSRHSSEAGSGSWRSQRRLPACSTGSTEHPHETSTISSRPTPRPG